MTYKYKSSKAADSTAFDVGKGTPWLAGVWKYIETGWGDEEIQRDRVGIGKRSKGAIAGNLETTQSPYGLSWE